MPVPDSVSEAAAGGNDGDSDTFLRSLLRTLAFRF